MFSFVHCIDICVYLIPFSKIFAAKIHHENAFFTYLQVTNMVVEDLVDMAVALAVADLGEEDMVVMIMVAVSIQWVQLREGDL